MTTFYQRQIAYVSVIMIMLTGIYSNGHNIFFIHILLYMINSIAPNQINEWHCIWLFILELSKSYICYIPTHMTNKCVHWTDCNSDYIAELSSGKYYISCKYCINMKATFVCPRYLDCQC